MFPKLRCVLVFVRLNIEYIRPSIVYSLIVSLIKKFLDRNKFSFEGEAYLLGGRYKELHIGERRVQNGEISLSCKIDLKIKALD